MKPQIELTFTMNLSQLSELLDQQAQSISALYDILHQETHIIANRNSKQIASVAQKKLHWIHQIQRQDALIGIHIQKNDFPLTDEENTLVAQIKAQFQQCLELNQANGLVLQNAQLSMHKLKNIFQEALGNEELTYDSEGRASGRKSLGTNIKI